MFFLFVKHKTAYELRIIDWSSDVCSSDLHFNPESKLWAGEVNNKLTDESINFTFQELHSPDVTVVVVTILGILCGISVLADLLRGCEKRAEEACGVGKVKSVKTKKSWAGIASCNLECEFVCKD